MSDKKLPKYSWLNFTEKQQIKQFMRKNPKTSLRICQKVFEEKFQRKIGLGSIHRVMKNEKSWHKFEYWNSKESDRLNSCLIRKCNCFRKIAGLESRLSIPSKSMFRSSESELANI